MITSDFLVIGGGVIGLSIARELRSKFGDAKVILIEKEPELGLHASGRNSGVLHAGFYYSADSLKAKFTRVGNQALTEYCESKGIPLNKCGKLVVAKNEGELPVLDELLARGKTNGVRLEAISEAEAKEIEPRVKTCRRALFSPTTSSVEPGAVMEAMRADALGEGVEIHSSVAYQGRRNGAVQTSAGPYEPGYLVNAAGLYADRIARDYGFSEAYRMWSGFSLPELVDILKRQAGLFFFAGFGFQRLAFEELRKYHRPHLVALSGELLEGVEPAHYRHWGKAGIRAQLLNVKTRKLEMDFVFERDERSLHVLNAVSPGFTCALPFSRYIVEHIG
jgi:L-2-hydroxyglutarate oxidase LhgO